MYRIPDRSLFVQDIPGTSSKQLHYYMNRKIPRPPDEPILIPKRLNSFKTPQSYKKQYEYNLQQQTSFTQEQKAAKKQFKEQHEFMYGHRHQNLIEYNIEIKSYNLQTVDIDGAKAGTNISPVLKNQEKAKKYLRHKAVKFQNNPDNQNSLKFRNHSLQGHSDINDNNLKILDNSYSYPSDYDDNNQYRNKNQTNNQNQSLNNNHPNNIHYDRQRVFSLQGQNLSQQSPTSLQQIQPPFYPFSQSPPPLNPKNQLGQNPPEIQYQSSLYERKNLNDYKTSQLKKIALQNLIPISKTVEVPKNHPSQQTEQPLPPLKQRFTPTYMSYANHDSVNYQQM